MEIIEGNIIAIRKGWAGQPDWHPHIVRFFRGERSEQGNGEFGCKRFLGVLSASTACRIAQRKFLHPLVKSSSLLGGFNCLVNALLELFRLLLPFLLAVVT